METEGSEGHLSAPTPGSLPVPPSSTRKTPHHDSRPHLGLPSHTQHRVYDHCPAPHLRNQVLMHPPQLGPLLPILGDDCLLIEFVSQIPILVIEHGAVQKERGIGWAGTSYVVMVNVTDHREVCPPPDGEEQRQWEERKITCLQHLLLRVWGLLEGSEEWVVASTIVSEPKKRGYSRKPRPVLTPGVSSKNSHSNIKPLPSLRTSRVGRCMLISLPKDTAGSGPKPETADA